MATVAQIKTITKYCTDLAKAAKSMKYLSAQLLANNSALAINWNALPAGSVDADSGKIVGTSIAPDEVSNVVGSLTAYADFWATHGGNFEKITEPIV